MRIPAFALLFALTAIPARGDNMQEYLKGSGIDQKATVRAAFSPRCSASGATDMSHVVVLENDQFDAHPVVPDWQVHERRR